MKKTIILLFITINLFGQSNSGDFLTTNFIDRVLHIKNGNSTGSSYVIEKFNRSFLVTAKHIFPNLKENDAITFQINQNKSWKNVTGKAHLNVDSKIDIIIFDLEIQLFGNNSDSYMRSGTIILGDEGYFLGFPFGFQTTSVMKDNNGFPVPFFKKAIFSGNIIENGVEMIVLDGQNNPGFSGGPIFFKSYENGKSIWNLIGIISGYIQQSNIVKTSLGDLSYGENSGLIRCVDQSFIIEIMNGINK